MFCKHCGNQLDANTKFCDKCGTAVDQPVSPSQSAQTPVSVNQPEQTTATTSVQASAQDGQLPPVQAVEKLASFGTIFKASWNNYKSKFWKLLVFQLLAYLPIVAMVILFVIAIAVGDAAKIDSTPLIVVAIVVGLVLVIAVLYWLIWVQAASVQYLFDQPALSIKETFKVVKPKLKNYFLSSLLSGALILLGFILLIIPGIIASLMLLFAPFIAIAENKGAVESIKTSREYARGRLSAIFGRNFLFGLVYFGIFLIPVIADAIIGSALDLENFQILENVLSFVIAPLATAFIIALYQSLKAVKGQVILGESKGTKWYVILAIIGAAIIPIMLLASVVLLALNSARVKSRDAKRVADVRQIASGLELYYAQTNRYPVNLSSLAPNYLGEIPQSPTPNDGDCTDIENRYSYSYLSVNDYALTFCLGTETGGLGAGKHLLTPKGIDIK